MKKSLLIILFFIVTINFLYAQSIVGKWKTLSSVIENSGNKKTDILSMQLKMWPCLAQLETIFEANGKQITKSPTKCGPIDYDKQPASSWKMNGNEISITNSSMPSPLGVTATYKVEFSGNKAVFTHEYTDMERKKLHTPKAIKVMITYVKI
jgi:hypothetical protein